MRESEVVKLIKENGNITIEEMSKTLNIKRRTLDRIIAELKEKNVIVRHKSNKNGYWEVVDNN